jgi:spermidine synthase
VSLSRLPPRFLKSKAPAADTRVAAKKLRTRGSFESAASREPADCFFDSCLEAVGRLGSFLRGAELPVPGLPWAGVPPRELLLRRCFEPFLGPGFFAILASTVRMPRRAERANGSEWAGKRRLILPDKPLQELVMKPRELIGTAKVPQGDEIRLFRRGEDFMIVTGRNELMNSRMSGSEEALATMTADRLSGRPSPHLLIGGYGMGFTLRAALAVLPRDARITLAEIMPEILDWARGPMAALTARCLDDIRVDLVVADVAEVLHGSRGAFDAILLDVDNGPDGLIRSANDRLYSRRGLAVAKDALKPGGILAIWSAAPDPAFKRRLIEAAFRVEETTVRARSNGKGARHTIWFAVPI